MVRRDPRQPFHARRGLRRGEQSAEIDLVALDRAGDAHPVVHLLGGDDDRIRAQRAHAPGHGLPGVGRGEGAKAHRAGSDLAQRAQARLGWISFCDITAVAGRKRSMIERT